MVRQAAPCGEAAALSADDQFEALVAAETGDEEPLAFEEALRQVERQLRLAAGAHRHEVSKLKTEASQLASRLHELKSCGDSGCVCAAGLCGRAGEAEESSPAVVSAPQPVPVEPQKATAQQLHREAPAPLSDWSMPVHFLGPIQEVPTPVSTPASASPDRHCFASSPSRPSDHGLARLEEEAEAAASPQESKKEAGSEAKAVEDEDCSFGTSSSGTQAMPPPQSSAGKPAPPLVTEPPTLLWQSEGSKKSSPGGKDKTETSSSSSDSSSESSGKDEDPPALAAIRSSRRSASLGLQDVDSDRPKVERGQAYRNTIAGGETVVRPTNNGEEPGPPPGFNPGRRRSSLLVVPSFQQPSRKGGNRAWGASDDRSGRSEHKEEVSLPGEVDHGMSISVSRASPRANQQGAEDHSGGSRKLTRQNSHHSCTSNVSKHSHRSHASRATNRSAVSGVSRTRSGRGDGSAQKEFLMLPAWEVDQDCLNVDRCPLFSVEVGMLQMASQSDLGSTGSAQRIWRNFLKCGVIHPQSKYRLAFDILALFVMVYDIVMIPVVIFFDLEEGLALTIMDWSTVLFWSSDVALSLNTGFYNGDGTLIIGRRQVIWNYARTWLSLDLCILVPEWFLLLNRGRGSFAESIGALKTVRFIRILRLLRLVKVDKIVRDLQARINSNYFLLGMGILRLLCCLSIVIHFVACLWYGAGSTQDGWVGYHNLMDATVWHKYLTSVHWSLTQFHGSTDINPTNELERLVAVVVLLVALIMFSSFLSSITHMMMQISSLRQERTVHLRALYMFLDDHNISPEVSVRVKKYVESKPTQQQKERDVEFLRLLPKQLMMDLHEEARIPTITENPFIFQLREKHPRVVRQLCHDAVFQACFQREDIIFAKGDSSQRVFFIEFGTGRYHHNGRVRAGREKKSIGEKKAKLNKGYTWGSEYTEHSVTSQGYSFRATRFLRRTGHRSFTNIRFGSQSTFADTDSPHIKDLRRGRWLAEASLWTRWEHWGDLEASSNCSILMLDGKEFQRVVENYDEGFAECVLYARAFVEALNCSATLSDIMEFTVRRQSMSIAASDSWLGDSVT